MRSYAIQLMIVLGVGLLMLACLGLLLPLELLFHLAFGWVLFLFRVVPRATVDGSGVLTAGICLASFAVGLHLFLRWFFDQAKSSAERRWEVRWTAAVVCV